MLMMHFATQHDSILVQVEFLDRVSNSAIHFLYTVVYV